jgi:hypothetical protein
MAEYLGAVASAVQLVDVALRASREAYGFLSAVKSAKEDVRELREGWSRLWGIAHADSSSLMWCRSKYTEFEKLRC